MTAMARVLVEKARNRFIKSNNYKRGTGWLTDRFYLEIASTNQPAFDYCFLPKNRRAAAMPAHAVVNKSILDPASGTDGGGDGGVNAMLVPTMPNRPSATNRLILVILLIVLTVVTFCAKTNGESPLVEAPHV